MGKSVKIWWKRKTKAEKILLVAVSILAAVFLVQLIKLIHDKVLEKETCYSEDCVQAASEILKFVDLSADPCRDFYRYACGGYLKNHFLEKTPSPVELLKAKAANQMTAILMEDVDEESDVTSLKALKMAFQACMNMSAIEEDDGREMVDLLGRIGGWPLLEGKEWKEKDFDWINATVEAKKAGLEYKVFINFRPYRNSEETLFMITPPWPGKPMDKDMQKEYVDYITDIVAFLNGSRYHASNEVPKIVLFEEQLIKIVQLVSDHSTKLPEPVTFKDLENASPHIRWLELVNRVAAPSVSFRPEDRLLFTAEEYSVHLLSLLGKTPKRTQANYFAWKVVQSNLEYLKQEVLDRKTAFELLRRGVKAEDKEERYKYCSGMLRQKVLPFAAEAAYARRYTTREKIEEISSMIAYLKREMKANLQKSDWIDAEDKDLALDKLDDIREHIGGTEEIGDGEGFDRMLGYDQIDLSRDGFLELLCEMRSKYWDYAYAQFLLGNSSLQYKWIAWKTQIEINAYYLNKENAMFLPAATLQGMFYNPKLPKYHNFGALGTVIGHEMTHGFADDGDDYGLNETRGWSNSTRSAYVKKISCFIEEYNDYNYKNSITPDIGKSKLKENVCDHVGADLSYKAYQKWAHKHGDEPILPGLQSATPNQLFWITTAVYQCSRSGRGVGNKILDFLDDHSEASFRVVAPLRNSEYFSEDFGCPAGSYMNPVEKCSLF